MSKHVKRSFMWSYFEELGPEFAKCKMCSAKVSYKSTVSNLKRHINRCHPTVDLTRLNEPEKRKSKINDTEDETNITVRASSSSVSGELERPDPVLSPLTPQCSMTVIAKSYNPSINLHSQSQSRLSSFLKTKITAGFQIEADNILLKLFYCDYQPFSIVADKGFTKLIKFLNPSYVLPSRQKISKTMIPALYEQRLSEIKGMINYIDKLTLTTDCWTSIQNETYLALTAHFVDQGKLKSALLSCRVMKGDHTGENLAAESKEIIDFWNTRDKIMIVISDNAHNITNTVKEQLKLKHYGCAPHKINLIVNAAMKKNQTIDKIIHDIKSIVTYFKKSTKATKKLMDCQKQYGNDNPKKLILSVHTRWNSTYYMVERFVDMEVPIKTTIALLDQALPLFSPNDWKIAKDLCLILEPFEALTRDLSGKKFPSASCLIVLINGLLDVFSAFLDSNEYGDFDKIIVEVILFIKSEITRADRFGSLEQSGTFGMCTFLDPRFKSLPFQNQTTGSKISENLKGIMVQRIKKRQTPSPIASTSSYTMSSTKSVIPFERKRPSIWVTFEKKVEHSAPTSSAESKAIIEIQRYLDDGYLDRHEDPIKWWEDHKYNYPIFSEIAKEWFSVVPTSVPCEQLFSKAGMILCERRSRLSGEKAKMLLFLNANMEDTTN